MSTEIVTYVEKEPISDSAKWDTTDSTVSIAEKQLQKEEYSKSLKAALVKRSDIVLDFTSLKACLDPLPAAENASESEEGQTNFDYKEFLYKLFDKEESGLSLQTLVIRNLSLPYNLPLSNSQLDNYASILHGLMQTSSLVEIDLSGNIIPDSLQSELQLWNLYNVKKLLLDKTGLKALPASVGRLRKLEVLSLSKNKLTDLPVTLGFCENLRVLNLEKNLFGYLPGIILKLKNLEVLRRLNYPYVLFGTSRFPHLSRSKTSPPKPKYGTVPVYNPDSLQMISAKAVIASQLDYWKHNILGPLQCKALDCLASTVTVCHNCNAIVPTDRGFAVKIMILTHLGLRDVFFMLHACSEKCQDKLVLEYTALQKKLQDKLDSDYEESKRLAERFSTQMDTETSSIAVTKSPPAYQAGELHTPRRKCSIM